MVSTGFTEAVVGDTDLLRVAVREGWIARRLVDDALTRCGHGTAALVDLIITGALERARLDALRQRLALERVPKALGSYRLRDVLGHGGMGIVYRAVAPDGEEVALKVLPFELAGDAKIQRRFRREAQVASALKSPHLVACRGMADDHGRLFIVMELMRGGTLEELVERCGGLPWLRAAEIARDLVAGLEAVHAAGLIHRDVKPANLFLTEDGRAKVGDFGIVRVDGGEQLTEPGRAIGTLGFMAPEQLDAHAVVDARADLYAVGATLFYALTGRAPFAGDDAAQVLSRVLTRAIPDPCGIVADCPASLAAIVRGAGALKREDRYRDASELRTDLELAIAGLPPLHAPPPANATTVVVRRERTRRGLQPEVLPALDTIGGHAPMRALSGDDARRTLASLRQRIAGWEQRGDARPRDLAGPLHALAQWAVGGASPFLATLLGATESLVGQLDAFTHHVNRCSLRTVAASLARADDIIIGRSRGPALDAASALVVDDDIISRKTMCQALRKVGLRVESAAEPGEALAALARAPDVRLVLSDVLMEGMNGFQFAAKVRADHPGLPIVFVTTLTDLDQVVTAGAAGISDVIAKPFLLMELAVKALTNLVADAPR